MWENMGQAYPLWVRLAHYSGGLSESPTHSTFGETLRQEQLCVKVCHGPITMEVSILE